MTSILKTDEIQSQNGGAVVKMQTLKHPSASGNNITLASDGSTTIANGTLSAGTIGNNVTVQSSFGVTDRTSLLVEQSGWSLAYQNMFSFNGIMFVSGRCHHATTVPSSNEAMIYINDSDYHPISDFSLNTISHVGDYAQRIDIRDDGYFYIINPVQGGADDTYFTMFNGFYRYA